MPALAVQSGVLLIGDSITEGTVGHPGGSDPDCTSGLCYAERLPTLLGDGFQVTNAGFAGSTTTDWTSDEPTVPYLLLDGVATPLFDGLAEPHLPSDYAVVMLGVNDAVGFFESAPTTADTYRRNLVELVEELTAARVEHVILATPSPLFAFDPTVQERLVRYASVIRALCNASIEVVCGPDLLSLLEPDDFEGIDLHPNALGHAKIASALADTITAIPEPSSALYLLLGLLALSSQQRFRSLGASCRTHRPPARSMDAAASS